MTGLALCICTRGRPVSLARLLGQLERLELPALQPLDLALVVCDNRPDGVARALCEEHRQRLPLRLVFVEEREPGISFARNRAVEAALELDAELVAFIDDDDEPSPDWLARLVRVQAESGADMVFGAWRHPAGMTPPPLLARLRFFGPTRLENHSSYGLPVWAGTFNVLLTRRLIEALASRGPLFRPEFALTGGGDTDLFIRAHRAGFAYAVAPDSVVYRVWEPDRFTLRGAMRRAFRTGCTRVQLARAHKPPAELRELRWRSCRKLVATLARMPFQIACPSCVAALLVRAAQHAGELYAGSGRRFLYYRDDGGQTLPRIQPSSPPGPG